MAKESGLGWSTCTVDDAAGSAKDIKNDVTSLQIGTPQALQDITGLDKSAIERLILLADGTVNLTGVFNAASDLSHDVFKDIGAVSVDRTVTLTISGQILVMEMVVLSYIVNRGADGSFTWTVSLALANGTVPTWST